MRLEIADRGCGSGCSQTLSHNEHMVKPVTHDTRRATAQDQAKRLVRLADFLPVSERMLVKAVYEEGKPVAGVAAMAGRDARAVRRSLSRLVRRVLAPEFAFVVVNREKWEAPRRNVATACLVEGLSIRLAAKRLRISPHVVRRVREAVSEMARAAPVRVGTQRPANGSV
jgi:hypothetical protein